MRKLLMVAGSVVFLVACGADSAREEEKPAGVIPQHQLDAMEKAKDVDDMLQQADQARREKIDESTN